MDIEKQFEAAFSKITLDNGQPLVSVEPEIVPVSYTHLRAHET